MSSLLSSRGLSALLLLGVGSLAGSSGCGAPAQAIAGKAPTTKDALGDAQCSPRALKDEPDLMGWDASSRAKLDRMRNEGLVAVRYTRQGCNFELELLPHCKGSGSYRYAPYNAKETIVVANEGELSAKLPLGAVQLGGTVKSGKSLRTDVHLVGTDALRAGKRIGRSSLTGPDCPRATHVVSTVYLGGFALVAGNRAELEGGASVFGLGASGQSSAKNERLQSEGSAEACEEAQKTGKEQRLCAVPLRVGLLSLDGVASEGDGKPAGETRPQSTTDANAPCPEGMARIAGGRLEMFGKMRDLGSYCLDKREVTAAEFEECVKRGKCEATNAGAGSSNELCNYRKADRGNHPINCIDPSDAKAYCQAQGKRLTRLEELEWAARGREQRAFPWGEANEDSRACIGRKKVGTCAAGATLSGATPEGVLDLSGNVEDLGEWGESYVGFGGSFFAEKISQADAKEHRGFSGPKDPRVGFRCASN